MRTLVFLLVLANLVFFAWTQGYFGERESPDALRLTQQLEADKLIVLSRDDPPRAKAVAEPAAESVAAKKAAQEKCLVWAGLGAAEAGQLEGTLEERFAGLRRTRHIIPEPGSWWVFIPPLPGKAEADKKAAELKRMGVPELFIIQEPGPNRFAISLGIFSSEQSAGERLEALRGKGVKSARKARRSNSRAEQLSLEVAGPETMLDAARQAAQQLLPDLKAAACGKD